MSANRDREEEIFDAARELAVHERAAYLAERCGQDADLRQRIEGMLAADAAAGEFFKTRNASASTVILADASRSPSIEKPGDRIGRYKLLQQIGEGGMGLVYMAEQDQPVRRSVALKIIKLGMDTRQVVARFEAERQALAMMNHPHIAKIFDAGATDSGRPYFVMELVRGIPITEYCDKNFLPTRQRLDLFILVCQAVQHAHQKGVIHRDLKPSNILVTLHDGVPWPMIIDFGVAKATHQRLTEKTLFTHFAQMIGTPAYMSPEQAEMSKLDVDTRTDIYALGVLLYELLTGSTPFPTKELLSLGYREMQRTIAEKEPPRLSTRLSTMANEERTVVAKNRSVDGSVLAKLIRGDLEWIVMKCLEKDRQRRYETANGLAADLKRHLNSDPIVARPPSTTYRLQKAFRRHKLAFAAGAAVVVSLVLGLAASAWQAVRATNEATRANQAEHLANVRLQESEQARTEAEAVSSFLTGMFDSTRPSKGVGGREVKVADVLDRAVAQLREELADQPGQRFKLQTTIGLTYARLGLNQDAIVLLEEARGYYFREFGPDCPDLVGIGRSLGFAYAAVGRRNDAIAMDEDIVRLAGKLFGADNSSCVEAMARLTIKYEEAGRHEDAKRMRAERIAVLEARLAACRRDFGPGDSRALDAMLALSVAYSNFGRKEEALEVREELLRLRRKVKGPEHPSTLLALLYLSRSCVDVGRHEEALALREELLRLRRKVLGPDNLDTIDAMGALSNSYRQAGRMAEAVTLCEEKLAGYRKVFGPDHPKTLGELETMRQFYDAAGRPDDALKVKNEVLDIRIKRLRSSDEETVERSREMIAVGRELVFQGAPGKRAEGQTLLLGGYAILVRLGDPVKDMDSYALGLALQDQGDLSAAEKFLRQALDYRRTNWPVNSPYLINPLKSLAGLLQGQGRSTEADTLYAEELEIRKKRLGEEDPQVTVWLLEFGDFLTYHGRGEQAMELYRQAGDHGSSNALNKLAWIHATSANPKLRDGKLAVRYAQRLLAPPNDKNPAHLDALAAAWAADGQFEKAVTVMQQAIPLEKDKEVMRCYLHRLKLYQTNQSYRSPESLADAASALLAEEKFVEANALCQEAIATAELGEADKRWLLGASLVSLAGAFRQHGQHREAEALHREELALQKKLVGPTHSKVADSLTRLADVLRDQGKPVEAARLFRDALAIRRKVLTPEHPALVAPLDALTTTLLAGEEFADAEPPARELLALRENYLPDHWLTDNARLMLGAALLGQKKHAEAEPLLLSGYEGLSHREREIPAEHKPRLDEALQRIVQLYEATGQPEQMAGWKKRLAEFNDPETGSKTKVDSAR